jgi:hypothetical protein
MQSIPSQRIHRGLLVVNLNLDVLGCIEVPPFEAVASDKFPIGSQKPSPILFSNGGHKFSLWSLGAPTL